MAVREMQSNIQSVFGLAPKTLSTGSNTGSVVDGKDYDNGIMGVYFSGSTGSTAAVLTPQVLESSSTGSTTFTAVADSDLYYPDSTAPEASAAITGQSGISRVSYLGTKRYVRFDVSASAAQVAGIIVERMPEVKPVSE